MTSLEKSIIATICYYDTLDYPLTAFEIYKYLVAPSISPLSDISFYKILDKLENSPELRKIVKEKNGFYFLRGKEKNIFQRIKRQKLADQKWKKARKIIWLLEIIPYLRMVVVSGSLVLGNTRTKSDIDLLIVTKAGRIWTCRILITVLITLLGKKRHKEKTRDKICLNHYITDKSLKIPFESLYNAQTYARLVNVYGNNHLFQQFQKANSWVKDYLVFWPKVRSENLRVIKKNKILIIIAKFLEIILNNKIGDLIEKNLGKWQEIRIKGNLLYKKSGGRITVNKNQLEFHPDSHEVGIIKGFNQRIRDLGFIELADQKDSGLNL